MKKIYESDIQKIVKRVINESTEISYENDVEDILMSTLEIEFEDVADEFEFEATTEQVEYKSRDGFASFIDGGVEVRGFVDLYYLEGTGKSFTSQEAMRMTDKYTPESTGEDEFGDSDGSHYAMLSIRCIYYKPSNDRAKEGKHTVDVQGIINFEDPYFRQNSKFEAFEEEIITFDNIGELDSKLTAAINTVKAKMF